MAPIRRLPVTAALIALSVAPLVHSQEAPATPPAPAAAPAATQAPARPQAAAARKQAQKKQIERFDKDGDGVLNAGERKAAAAEREAKLLERFDADGDGKLSETERAAARPPAKNPPAGRPGATKPDARKKPAVEAVRQKLLQRFDADSDGVLSETERAAARKARQSRQKKAGDS